MVLPLGKTQLSNLITPLRLCDEKPILHTPKAILCCFTCSASCNSALRQTHLLFPFAESDTLRTRYVTSPGECHKFIKHRMSQ